mmetsp:Transcript_63379/g.169478  ORF Transcript_63379/g.169478 Transcript_63379/m.169478 type:complete len:95 (+) Transcript_63379:181-465(+)
MWRSHFAPRGCKLIYNTGRSLEDYRALLPKWNLLTPDYFIGGCGTQIFTFENDGMDARADTEWLMLLEEGWDKRIIAEALQSCSYLRGKVGTLS